MMEAPFTVLDGGLSTALESLGVDLNHHLWTARTLLESPDLLVEAHTAFARAGAQVLITASYQAGLEQLTHLLGSPAEARALVASTTQLARTGLERAGVAGVVAASLGPYGALLADGSEYSGRYDATWSEVARVQRARLEVLVESEPDWLAIETVPTRAEADTVLDLLMDHPGIPAWVCFTCRDSERTWGGDPIEEAVALAASCPRVEAVGVNCTDPQFVGELLERAATATTLPLVAYPNHGREWNPGENKWVGVDRQLDRQLDWESLVPGWVASGARLIGGCCGVGPREIALLADLHGEMAAEMAAQSDGSSSR